MMARALLVAFAGGCLVALPALAAQPSPATGDVPIGAGGSLTLFVPPGQPANHGIQPMFPRRPVPHNSVPPPPDPRDFEGGWTGMFGVNEYDRNGKWIEPPFTPEGARIYWYRVEMNNAGTPVADTMVQCKPMGPLLEMSAEFGREVLQTPHELLWLANEDHLMRRIEIGGVHPRDLKPSYLGNSVAHWEGDTLVIDTIGFNDRTWLDYNGAPHSKQLHLIEHLRKFDHGYQLEDVVTIEDSVMYMRPWTIRLAWNWAPITAPALEVVCEENNLELSDFTAKDLQKHDP